jgi:hypothetical protein
MKRVARGFARGHRRIIALAAVAAALGAAGCGDDESGAETTPSISIPSVTVPTAPTTTAPSGGVAPQTTTGSDSGEGGSYDPAKPDTPENDVPPPPGSPQEAFEQMCEQNPAACG